MARHILSKAVQYKFHQLFKAVDKLKGFSVELHRKYTQAPQQTTVYNKHHVIDLRSDTVTKPSEGMRRAMAEAEVGDDVLGEDPTINELQRRCAELFGKEQALFVPSGTMGNLLSVCVHCPRRGEEAIMGSHCHIFVDEQGGISFIAGVLVSLLENKPDGTFDIDLMKKRIRQIDDPHFAYTRLICLENTHCFCGGKVVPLTFMEQVYRIAKDTNVKVHLDGARVMNAATALNIPVKDILKYTDSVNVCFSKGLSAPVGSVIAGTDEFIYNAKRLRRALGGGIRQGGMLAAAALYALDNVVPRLSIDHELAISLSKGIMERHSNLISIDINGVHTNIVFITMLRDEITAYKLHDRLLQVTDEERRSIGEAVVVKTFAYNEKLLRFVLHCDISSDDVGLAIKKFQFVLQEFADQTNSQ